MSTEIDQLILHPSNTGKGAALRSGIGKVTGDIVGVYLASSVGLVLHKLALHGFHEYFSAPILLAKVLAIGLVFF